MVASCLTASTFSELFLSYWDVHAISPSVREIVESLELGQFPRTYPNRGEVLVLALAKAVLKQVIYY